LKYELKTTYVCQLTLSPFYLACAYLNFKIIEKFLKRDDVEFNKIINGRTAFIRAFERKRKERSEERRVGKECR